MTLKEEINILIRPGQLRKKFDELEEEDWAGAQQAIAVLLKRLDVKEKIAQVNENAAGLAYRVLSTKFAEMMSLFDDHEFNLKDSQRVDLLEGWMDKSVKYTQNLDALRKAAGIGKEKKKKTDNFDELMTIAKNSDIEDEDYIPEPSEDWEDDVDNETDISYYSPEEHTR